MQGLGRSDYCNSKPKLFQLLNRCIWKQPVRWHSCDLLLSGRSSRQAIGAEQMIAHWLPPQTMIEPVQNQTRRLPSQCRKLWTAIGKPKVVPECANLSH